MFPSGDVGFSFIINQQSTIMNKEEELKAMEELLNDALGNVAFGITAVNEIDFLFRNIKSAFIIKMLAAKLVSYGVTTPK